jgi:hypothetical protein
VLAASAVPAEGAEPPATEEAARARAAAATALADAEQLGDKRDREVAFDHAARLAERAVKLDESNAEGHYLLFWALGRWTEMQNPLRQAMTLPRLRREIDRTIQLDPRHARGLSAKGEMLFRLPALLGGDRAGAEAYLRRAIAADDTYWHAYVVLARVLAARGRPAEAETVLRGMLAHVDVQPDERSEALTLLGELRASGH